MRKLILLYIALMLSLSSVGAHAAAKKTNKHTASGGKYMQAKNITPKNKSNKYALAKYKPNSKASTHRVKLRLSPQKAAIVYADVYDGSGPLELASSKALVINQLTGETIFAKNTNQSTPIASVTKLMTAMVMLDAHLPMDDLLYISDEDVDYLKGTRSRLAVGSPLSRGELLQLALMSSENRAASALGRNYPGGINAFISAMNRKAEDLGMKSTRFYDTTGLDSSNVSTAEDLVKMVNAAYHYPEIRQVSTAASQEITLYGRENPVNFVNTNSLVRGGDWVIGLSKTGFINEAGRCLVMQAEISGQPMIIVLLNSSGKLSRIGDANRIRKWIEHNDAGSLGENVSG
ncbi:MAG: D-alanyl-D-alanine endopeptidase [Methylotenera sp.]|jgi:D-alanyl-D-alanine endopeptidase (penicillin-binding protein 7)|nr:D-alanyl-D-alanine endopeptidase [Methylotenera sp.]MDO9204877.1 D-alanyl-D-alanine endopeptidase [Methylotenera sp.]MDO9393809.1 D-alanyl-D-alanine endopeptidase [Methylotenera sp.]MDP1523828.1 D-alanyl-D-alanine endopeptidase [Methylotenera sp.]MDP2231943.1 D-alanyl-D-alanine endopeptidase [Methylotenera sp.]MDP3141042.1 D-alanyl-D-alanine endopeptidase [Methylotenera sp.]